MIKQQTHTSVCWVKATFVCRLALFLFVLLQSWKTLDKVVEYIIEHILINVHITVVKWRRKKKVGEFASWERQRNELRSCIKSTAYTINVRCPMSNYSFFVFFHWKKPIAWIIIYCLPLKLYLKLIFFTYDRF